MIYITRHGETEWNTQKKVIVNGKIKCRKSVNLNVGFPTFYFTIYSDG